MIMPTSAFDIVIAIFGGLTVSCLAWIFQRAFVLGTRVTILETKQADLPTLINAKFDEVNRRLGRIEAAMNGSLRY